MIVGAGKGSATTDSDFFVIDVASSSVSGSVVFPPFLSLSLKDVDLSFI